MIRKINVLFLGFLLITILHSCEKDNDSKSLISINGITELDNSANNLGLVDTTDWKFTDTWTLNEENLFKKNNPNHNSATENIRPNSSILVVGYPNPAKSGVIKFCFQLADNMYYDMRIVDKNLNIKQQFDSVKYNLILMKDSAYINNELYRLYYKVYTADKKVYRGHGDFKFVK